MIIMQWNKLIASEKEYIVNVHYAKSLKKVKHHFILERYEESKKGIYRNFR